LVGNTGCSDFVVAPAAGINLHMGKLLRRASLRMSDEILDQSLETLVAFLRSEMYAVKTYDDAVQRVSNAKLRDELSRLRNSHFARALLLRERIDEFGGTTDCGDVSPWGAFAAARTHLTNASDDMEALLALEEGEAWGVRDYEIDLDAVEAHLRHEIGRIVIPEQRRTREVAKRLLESYIRRS
jgi:hypothetical protein